MTDPASLTALEQRATPAPWNWNVSLKSRSVVLEGNPKRGLEVVMDFVRWGMSGATPRFRTEDCLMENAEQFSAPVEGRLHHEAWYRTINHPDAQLIVAMRNALPEMLAELGRLRARGRPHMCQDCGASEDFEDETVHTDCGEEHVTRCLCGSDNVFETTNVAHAFREERDRARSELSTLRASAEKARADDGALRPHHIGTALELAEGAHKAFIVLQDGSEFMSLGHRLSAYEALKDAMEEMRRALRLVRENSSRPVSVSIERAAATARAEALEEAAKVCEEFGNELTRTAEAGNTKVAPFHCAKRIRALAPRDETEKR